MKTALIATALVTTAAMPATALAEVTHVDASDFKFSPKTVKVAVRDKVRWTSTDGKHDVSFVKADGITFSERINEGQSISLKFGGSGTYNYICKIHKKQGMKGTVVVK